MVGIPTLTTLLPELTALKLHCPYPLLLQCTDIADLSPKMLQTRKTDAKIMETLLFAERCKACRFIVRSFLDSVREDGSITLYRNTAALRIGHQGRGAVRFSTLQVSLCFTEGLRVRY
jgi:hypothetical protein